MLERELAIFSPIPPEQNGIADYASHLVSALDPLVRCAIYANQPNGILPCGVPVRDPLQAFRYLRRGDPVLHQVGNNPGHIFVLEALRKWGGVTTLHDQNLHYLYEASNAPKPLLIRNMKRVSEKLCDVFARHWFDNDIKTAANYALFDMLDEVLSLSSEVIVHSRFAKNRIRLLYGTAVAERVHVVPHLALPPDARTEGYLQATAKIPPGAKLIVTSGFATYAKRFDWLVEALDEIAKRGIDFFWVHAGKERPDEYDLSGLLERYPDVKRRSHITGYLTEEQLNECVADCDVLVNLRFPSVGESSGTLARAMAAGRCCIVSATAAYADIPRDAVVHVPVINAVPALVESLSAVLADEGLRHAVGAAALALARTEWAPEAVARAYVNIMAAHGTRPLQTASPQRRPPKEQRFAFPIESLSLKDDIRAQLQGYTGSVNIWLCATSARQLAQISMDNPHLFESILPLDFQLSSVTLEPYRGQQHGLGESLSSTLVLALKGMIT